jgi:hypothetical protein
MFVIIAGALLVMGGLVLALPVAVLAVVVAIRRRQSWAIAAWVAMTALAAGAIYLVMYAPPAWRQSVGITGESDAGTLRGTMAAGIALLLPPAALFYGFWHAAPSRWAPVVASVLGVSLAADLIITH